MARKSSLGRQKIEIKKIEDPNNRQVCFSKRRSGIVKKASELCILSGAKVAVIVFSPAGKAFSFGHPSVGYVIDQHTDRSTPFTTLMGVPDSVGRGAPVGELQRQYDEMINQMENAKKKKEELDQKAKNKRFWWEEPIEELGLEELQKFGAMMLDLRKNLARKANEYLVAQSIDLGRPYDVKMTDVGYDCKML